MKQIDQSILPYTDIQGHSKTLSTNNWPIGSTQRICCYNRTSEFGHMNTKRKFLFTSLYYPPFKLYHQPPDATKEKSIRGASPTSQTQNQPLVVSLIQPHSSKGNIKNPIVFFHCLHNSPCLLHVNHLYLQFFLVLCSQTNLSSHPAIPSPFPFYSTTYQPPVH